MDWAAAMWCTGISASTSYEEFLRQFRLVFEHPEHGLTAGQRLLNMRQGESAAADYAISFRVLAAESGWNAPAQRDVFIHGLQPDLRREVASRDARQPLDEITSLAITLDLNQVPTDPHPAFQQPYQRTVRYSTAGSDAPSARWKECGPAALHIGSQRVHLRPYTCGQMATSAGLLPSTSKKEDTHVTHIEHTPCLNLLHSVNIVSMCKFMCLTAYILFLY